MSIPSFFIIIPSLVHHFPSLVHHYSIIIPSFPIIIPSLVHHFQSLVHHYSMTIPSFPPIFHHYSMIILSSSIIIPSSSILAGMRFPIFQRDPVASCQGMHGQRLSADISALSMALGEAEQRGLQEIWKC